MLSRRWLCAPLIFAGLLASAALSASELSVGLYLRDPQVHNFQLTEEKLQAFDRAERRIYSLKPSDPVVTALSRPVPHNAPLSKLVETLEATPVKPLVESSGMTVHDWLIMEMVLKATKAAYNYYSGTGKNPGNIVSRDNMTFYGEHKTEIETMSAGWSKLLSQQVQKAQPQKVQKTPPLQPPAPKDN